MIARSRRRVAALSALVALAAGAGVLLAAGAGSPLHAQAMGPAAAAIGAAGFTLEGERTQGGWLRGIAPSGTLALSLDGAPVALDASGHFIVAFDRDAPLQATLVAELDGGRRLTQALAISPRAWRIERVGVGPRPGAVPSEEFQRRRAADFRACSDRSASTMARRAATIRAPMSPPERPARRSSPRPTGW
jgi:hypothetical protein